MLEDKKFAILEKSELIFKLKCRLLFKKFDKKPPIQITDIRVRGP